MNMKTTPHKLIDRTSAKVKGQVLMIPLYIEPDPNDAIRSNLDSYGTITLRIAKECGAVFVDTQAAFEPVLKHLHPALLVRDRMHPSARDILFWQERF